jgi:hypothetical protein
MEQSRQQTRAAAGAAAGTGQSTDCAHLHSAFGPGCPHCWTASTPPARPSGARPSPESLGKEAA